MASARLVRNLISSECGLPQILQNFFRFPTFSSSCLKCGRTNYLFRGYSTIPETSSNLKKSQSFISFTKRHGSTKMSTRETVEDGNQKSSSSSSLPDRPASSDRNAETDASYFKNIGEQPSVSQSMSGRVDWKKFVDPERLGDPERLVDPERFGDLKRIGDLKQLRDSEGLRDPERIRDPKRIIDPEVLGDLKRLGDPEGLMDPERPSLVLTEDKFGRQTPENPFLYPRKNKSKTNFAEMEIDDVDWKELEKSDPENRPFEKISDLDSSLSDVQPALQPFSHNLAAFANESENIQKLVEMGVEVWKFDKDPEMSQRIMTAEWDSKIQPWIDWMKDLGLTDYDMKVVMGKHPRIFKESIQDLQTRVAYFESKKFVREIICQILVRAPQTFSWNVRYIDKRLGELQKLFKLSGEEVRQVVAKQPKLIVFSGNQLTILRLTLINEMGFSGAEVKRILLEKPKIFRQTKQSLLERFDYLQNVCQFSHELILQFPQALLTRKFRVKERHLFLKSTRKNQYDPTKPGYVSLSALVSGRDSEFCTNVAKVPVEVFNEFIKTL